MAAVLSHWRSYRLLVYAEFFFATGMKRDAGYQRNALSNRHHFGVHPLVLGLSIELSPSGGNDAGARRVCRPFLDQPLGDPVSALA